MGQYSGIEWCDHTWNPWIGCMKVSPGCANCYAERDMTRKERWANTWGPAGTTERPRTKTWGQLNRFARLAQEEGRRHRVFTMSLGDMFEDNPDLNEMRVEALGRMPIYGDWLDFLILTKRAENVLEMVPRAWIEDYWPQNVWVGFSAEDQNWFDERWEHARYWGKYGNPVTWVSAEPLLGSISLPTDFLYGTYRTWVIAGGESGPGARPTHPNWVRKLHDQCTEIDSWTGMQPVPFFFKQWGEWLPDGQTFPGYEFGQEVKEVPVKEVDEKLYFRFGKKKAGALLDGDQWRQFPA